ncbi:hypothetical protein [Sphingobium sp.]|uniref:hypothetical protein n=1 Tax=Sphingobium sp. TaxID=1912891 RepID=UPI00257CDEA7|nr:hypothetical protein [Sphingobium sp.]MBR2268298.1 hypothetical protein [Sphingobium sp.]
MPRMTDARRARRDAAFAEVLAETGDIDAAGRAVGVGHEGSKKIFAQIRRQLGWQAQ